MKTSPAIPPVTHPAGGDALAAVLTSVEADLHASGDGPVALSVVSTDETGVDVRIRPLDADHPIGSLYGYTCPPEWAAFGVVVPGRAHRLDDLATAPEAIRLGLVIDRSGRSVSLLRRQTGSVELTAGPDTGEGRLPDACRRVLGLPTPAPDTWPGRLWVLMWVESLFVESLADPGSVSWPQAVRSHPAIDHVLRLDAEVASELPHRFVEMVEIISRRFGWDRLRHLACEGALAGLGVSPPLAAWMDDGMFSREVLGAFPPLPTLV
ncbi:MAG TPA: hypothetical protein VIJ47_09235, partial [Acidimicrobiales bacterium]